MPVAPLLNNPVVPGLLFSRHNMIHPRGDTPAPTIDVQFQMVQGIEVPQPNLRTPRVQLRQLGNYRRRKRLNPPPVTIQLPSTPSLCWVEPDS